MPPCLPVLVQVSSTMLRFLAVLCFVPVTRGLSTASPLYCLNVQLCVKPEVRAQFLECIKANQRGTLTKEPLAKTYIFGEDEKTPNTFHFFEQCEYSEPNPRRLL